MKKYFLVNLLFLSFLFVGIHPLAFAHFPATDKDIIVVLHIDPNDSPIPTQQAMLSFEIVDNTDHFTPQACACSLTVIEQGTSIYSAPVDLTHYHKLTIWNISLPFTFPHRDVYHIVLTGAPKTANAFQPFSVAWDFRVDSDFSGIVVEKPSDVPYLLGALGVGIVFLGFFGWFIKKEIIDVEEKKAQYISRQHKK